MKTNVMYYLYHAWQDGGVILDRRSGYTHLLDMETMLVFQLVTQYLEEPVTLNNTELSLLVSQHLPVDTTIQIDLALDRLTKLSLLSN